jgi:hypothetical protein
MNNNDLEIQEASNGFIAYQRGEYEGLIGEVWAFETPESLSKFILEWAVKRAHSGATSEK